MKKNKYILILFSFLLSISSICGLLFKDSAHEKHNIVVEIEKENNKNIYIETLDINNNNYLANQKFNYNEKKDIYTLKENSIEFTVTNNDNYLLNIQDKNIKNISVYDNEKEIDVYYDEENHLYNISHSINKYEILKQQFNKTNLILILFLGITFAVLYYFVFLFFKNFVCKIFCKKLKIYEIFIFAGLLFILYYLNFYSLLSLIGYLFIPILFAIMGLTLLHYGKQNKLSFESSYLFMALVLLITLVFLIPPFHILDEDNHYIKSYDHLFLLEKSNFDQNGYTHLSKNIHEFRYKYSNFKFNLIKLNPIAYYDDMNLKINYKDLNGSTEKCDTYRQHVLDYIPSNFAIFLCKKLNTNVLLTILLSRFFNVVLSVLIGYFALKIMPKFKNLLFLIMTFANTYQSCIGINQDWINTPTCFLFIAYIFYLIFKKEQVKIKDYIILILIGTVIAFSKTVYTPIILFVLMIDNKKFEKIKIKHALINKILLIITVALITVLAYKWNAIFTSDNNTTEQVVINNNFYTVSEALNDPVELVLMYFRTIKARLFEDTLKGFIDGFGWYTIWNNKIIKLFMLITYVGLIITLPYEKIKNRGIFKSLSLFIYTSICLLISAALLFGWTKTGAKTIEGLQPRYFIPIIFGLYFILNNNIFKISKTKNYNTYFIYVIFGLNFISFFEIIYRLF